VQACDPLAARLTKDVDVAIDRADLPRIADALQPLGLEYRHAAGVDMFVESRQRSRSVIRLVFVREKVRPHYIEAVPDVSDASRTDDGLVIASIADLLRMKLTSLRLRDKTHVIDMDAVGLITPEIEAALPQQLRDRLQQVREEERQSGR